MHPGSPLPKVAAIKRAVAREYGLTPALLSEPAPHRRTGVNVWPISRPRQVAMALSTLLTDHSRARIGHFFGGRHPATVRHACEAVARRRRADPALHNTMRRLTLELLQEGRA